MSVGRSSRFCSGDRLADRRMGDCLHIGITSDPGGQRHRVSETFRLLLMGLAGGLDPSLDEERLDQLID